MAYFYSVPFSFIEELDVESFQKYWDAITIIEAQEMLNQITVADWPHMKKGSREKLHKGLYRKAYPSIFREQKQVSMDDLARILKG